MRLIAVLPLLALSGNTPVTPSPPTNPVVKVSCTNGWGTAFRISPTRLITVAHVIAGSICTINGKPFTVDAIHGDFAIISLPDATDDWLTTDCRGFVKGRDYIAEGYARNGDGVTSVGLVSDGVSYHGESELVGVQTVIPGQSGGPIIDVETLKVVGAVNAYDSEDGYSFSTELRGQSVCKEIP